MNYLSTRGGMSGIAFRDAVLTGMARDGGLLLPETIPDVSRKLMSWKNLPYEELAFEIMRLYADIPEDDLRRLIHKSYSVFRDPEVTPVRKVGDVHILELFHGPTLAFKDVALQFLGNLFDYSLAERKEEMNILAATSGDTGSAAIHGVRGLKRVRIFVMHPYGKVSKTQERQMTTVLDKNVFNIAVQGSFDDCQQIMKTIFNDLAFKDRYSLGAVNSINWARLLAQIVYYFYAAFRVMKTTGKTRIRFSVPTGNFGDIFAGYLATKMGLPVAKLVLATNENDILARFFNTGDYSIGHVRPTISPSMDIQIASNFERYLYYRLNCDPKRLSALMKDFQSCGSLKVVRPSGGSVDEIFAAGAGNTDETLDTIRNYYETYGYLLDPHSAVGVAVGTRFMNSAEPTICLATAHPAKFSEAIIHATGKNVATHPLINDLEGLPTRCEILPSSVKAVSEYVERKISDARVQDCE
ncbi:MAG: threonine synthase [Lentisphaerae bacterium]|nr:threonine synthase [Lentisphaerota bacterium]